MSVPRLRRTVALTPSDCSRSRNSATRAFGVPAEAIRRAVAGFTVDHHRTELVVRRARVRGLSWAAIATLLGVSRQAVHRKYSGSRFGRGGD